MYVLNIGLTDANLNSVFEAVASQMGSIKGDYNSNHDFEDFKGRLKVVAEEWMEVSSMSWSKVFDLTPYEVLIVTPGRVFISVTAHRININFGRDSESLAGAIINSVSNFEVELHDGDWRPIERKATAPSY